MNTDHQMAASAVPAAAVVASGDAAAASNAHSSQELDRDHPVRSSGNKDREGLRASQSFDESVTGSAYHPQRSYPHRESLHAQPAYTACRIHALHALHAREIELGRSHTKNNFWTYMTIQLSQLMLNLYVVSFARSFFCIMQLTCSLYVDTTISMILSLIRGE